MNLIALLLPVLIIIFYGVFGLIRFSKYCAKYHLYTDDFVSAKAIKAKTKWANQSLLSNLFKPLEPYIEAIIGLNYTNRNNSFKINFFSMKQEKYASYHTFFKIDIKFNAIIFLYITPKGKKYLVKYSFEYEFIKLSSIS